MSRSGPIEHVVICGGGTAGWMAAAALRKMLGATGPRVTLVESAEIGTIGVGEATIPPIVQFNQMLGIDEAAFIRATHATMKLGIEFVDWHRLGSRYMHPFGKFGADMNETSFTHFWLRAVSLGLSPDLMPFSAEMQAAYAGRFAPRGGGQAAGPKIHYAYQFDAAAYAGLLRGFAEGSGVERREGRIETVELDSETGFVNAVRLDGERRLAGDLFIDCTGFRGVLIGDALGSGFEDWSRWLPANRAVTIQTAGHSSLQPYTRATAREAGWQWRIPLQHRTGNGYVFCADFLSDEDAAVAVRDGLDAEPLGETRLLRFATGRRRSWVRNCVALGLSSGFLEPLESTSIHLIQHGINSLLSFFPDRACDARIIARYNDEAEKHVTGIRDFIIAHYKLTERADTPFWRHCRAMEIPDSLVEKLALFTERGETFARAGDLFKEVNWFAILYGQGLRPQGWHPLANASPEPDLRRHLSEIARLVAARVVGMPQHEEFLRRVSQNC